MHLLAKTEPLWIAVRELGFVRRCTPRSTYRPNCFHVFTCLPAWWFQFETACLETMQRAMAEKTLNFPWQFQRPDGTRFDAEIKLTRLDVAGEAYLIGMVGIYGIQDG